MRKTFNALLALVLLAATFQAGAWYHRRTAVSASTAAASLYYTCPMHPQYRSDHPGTCPVCGMNLEPMEQASEGGAAARALHLCDAAAVSIGP